MLEFDCLIRRSCWRTSCSRCSSMCRSGARRRLRCCSTPGCRSPRRRAAAAAAPYPLPRPSLPPRMCGRRSALAAAQRNSTPTGPARRTPSAPGATAFPFRALNVFSCHPDHPVPCSSPSLVSHISHHSHTCQSKVLQSGPTLTNRCKGTPLPNTSFNPCSIFPVGGITALGAEQH